MVLLPFKVENPHKIQKKMILFRLFFKKHQVEFSFFFIEYITTVFPFRE